MNCQFFLVVIKFFRKTLGIHIWQASALDDLGLPVYFFRSSNNCFGWYQFAQHDPPPPGRC